MVFSFLLEQILSSPFPRGFGLKINSYIEFCVGLFIFVGAFVGLNFVGYSYRDSVRKFYPLRIIGGHITAFAGITCFGTAQIAAGNESEFFKHHHYVIVVLAGACLIILRELSRHARTPTTAWLTGWPIRFSFMPQNTNNEMRATECRHKIRATADQQ